MKFLAFVLWILITSHAFAIPGGQEGSGGDMCEDRFKIVRDDLNVWILGGGSTGLSLPQNVDQNSYNLKMLQSISIAKINCTDDPVEVGGIEKTCKNFYNPTGEAYIVCNSKRFFATSESDQYVLVHHEYAGLAGYESSWSGNSDSNYMISNQISGFLADQVMKHLVIKPYLDPNDPFNPSSCQGPPITKQEALAYFLPAQSTSQAIGSSEFYQRFRECNTLTGCANWQSRPPQFVYNLGGYPASIANYSVSPGHAGAISFSTNNGEIYLNMPEHSAFSGQFGVATISPVACTSLYIPETAKRLFYSSSDWFSDSKVGPNVSLIGTVTNHCLRLSSTYQTPPFQNGSYHDVETVWYGKF